MLRIKTQLTPERLGPKIARLWEASAPKLRSIEARYDPSKSAPVYTVRGVYTSRAWAEWTQGFQFGSAVLQFDATGDKEFLLIGRSRIIALMSPHVTNVGSHDHGFNNISAYGNLLRLFAEERASPGQFETYFYAMALKASGAVQAARWSKTSDGGGYIYSFCGPHSLFVDTIRSLRSLAVGHKLGQVLLGDHDKRISLLERLIQHARTTARWSIYYGEGRDIYDVPGRTAHECLFDGTGTFYGPNTQQGFSPYSTWTRGLAWAMCGFAEQLEYLKTVPDRELLPYGGRQDIEGFMRKAAQATCDFYIENCPSDGIPYWDTAAPGLAKLGDYLNRPADPFNDYEPVDSSAASIAAQGLLRLGRYLNLQRYWQAGLTILDSLFDEPYLSTNAKHEGLILHSVYHRPNGWDHVPEGKKIPCGESSMWGDFHAREVALYVQRLIKGGRYLTFWP